MTPALRLVPGASWLGPETSHGARLDWSAIAGAIAPGRLALPHRQPYAGGELLLVGGAAFLRCEPFADDEVAALAAEHAAAPSLVGALPCGDLPLAFFPREGPAWVSAATWAWAGLDRGAWWGEAFVHPQAPDLVFCLRHDRPFAPAQPPKLKSPVLELERVVLPEGELLRPRDPTAARLALAVWRFAVGHGLSPALYEELGHVARGLDVKESAHVAGRKINAIRMRRAELRTATGTSSVLELAARIHAAADVQAMEPRTRPSRKARPYYKPVKRA